MNLENSLSKVKTEYKVLYDPKRGVFTIRNKGRQGKSRTFILLTENVVAVLKCMEKQLNVFMHEVDYREKSWRNKTKRFISDAPAKTLFETQTKSMFCLVSKLLHYYAEVTYRDSNSLPLSKNILEKAIRELT